MTELSTPYLNSCALLVPATQVREKLNRNIGEWISSESVDLQMRADFLRDLRAIRLAFAEIEALVEASTARLMTKNRQEVGDLELVRRGGSKTVWCDGAMATAIGWAIEAHFTDQKTGELPADFDLQTAYAVRDFLIELYGAATIKTTPLKDLGVDIDELVTREPSRRTVQIIDKSATSEDGAA